MGKFFHKLKVSQKLLLISVFFLIPDALLLSLYLLSISGHIEFARAEKQGNEYQRPLQEVFEGVSEHLWLASRPGPPAGAAVEKLVEVERQIDDALQSLAEVDGRLGARLQFTREGLAKRGREAFTAAALAAQWREFKTAWPSMGMEERARGHDQLVAHVRAMITHAGDNSNLILDPDLDSYYLMDVSLLALPQMQDRLSKAVLFGEGVLRRGQPAAEERSRLAAFAAMLREADLDRLVASTHSSLNEDPNFYGKTTTLEPRLLPKLERLKRPALKWIAMTERIALGETAGLSPEDYLAAGIAASRASFTLWHVAKQELDALLDERIAFYAARRLRSLIITACALAAAASLVTFITRSISGPLQRQAAALQQANEAFEAEITERRRMEEALRAAEEKYRSIFENAVEGIFQTTRDGRYLVANPTLARMYGYESAGALQREITNIGSSLYVDPSRRAEFQRLIEANGVVHRFESEIRRRDGCTLWISEHARAVRDAAGNLAHYEGTVQDITERKRQEAELSRAQQGLVTASRMAGMAEVATGILHNVGNVLNSVNISANFIAEKLHASKLPNIGRIAALLRANEGRLADFLAADAKGSQIPAYLSDLAEHLAREQAALIEKAELLRKHLDHIKQIVAVQQTWARVAPVTEPVSVAELVEDALRLDASALDRHEVEVLRQYEAQPVITVDKHKTLQILVNLITNARHACSSGPCSEKRVTVGIARDESRVRIAVSDNGVGIPRENLRRVFNHGFTTRKDGHGFGLHSGALAAKEMGGALTVESPGAGQGATFTLELPA